MFQFMAGLGFAHHFNRELVVNTSWYRQARISRNRGSVNSSRRNLEISRFKSFAETRRELIKTPSQGRFERLVDFEQLGLRKFLKIGSEQDFTMSTWSNPEKIKRLMGYFMSSNFFLGLDSRQIFSDLVSPMSAWSTEQRKIFLSKPGIGVHVRLGDYLAIGDKQIPSEIYFINGIEMLKRVLGSNVEVFLFTDDLENLEILYPKLCQMANIVIPPNNLDSVESLLLLGSFSAYVASNSTFSWWATILSGVKASLIVRPSHFFTDNSLNIGDLQLWDPRSIKLDPIRGEI